MTHPTTTSTLTVDLQELAVILNALHKYRVSVARDEPAWTITDALMERIQWEAREILRGGIAS